MGHEDELMTEEIQEILNEEHQETQLNVSPSEQEEDERGPIPTSAIKDLLKKWETVRAMVLEWHANQADVSRLTRIIINPCGNRTHTYTKKLLISSMVVEVGLRASIEFPKTFRSCSMGLRLENIAGHSIVQYPPIGGIRPTTEHYVNMRYRS
ncbi:uncharacterized protein TNCV_1887751 [Trichonephila clavipes]|nr:uncharacterized protein TNCV_1887751 [Trichonephila clavipes]